MGGGDPSSYQGPRVRLMVAIQISLTEKADRQGTNGYWESSVQKERTLLENCVSTYTWHAQAEVCEKQRVSKVGTNEELINFYAQFEMIVLKMLGVKQHSY